MLNKDDDDDDDDVNEIFHGFLHYTYEHVLIKVLTVY